MTRRLVKSVLYTDSNLDKDACVNTFVIATADIADPFATQDVADLLTAFYHGLPASRWAGTMNGGADRNRHDFYVMGDLDPATPEGSPIDSVTWTLVNPGQGAGQDLPSEVAAVITWYGVGRNAAPVEQGNTHPKARLTGRTFIGRLSAMASGSVAGETRIGTDDVEDLSDMGQFLITGLAALANPHHLYVWSRAGESLARVVGGTVDNAWDTVRTRGVEASLARPFGASG